MPEREAEIRAGQGVSPYSLWETPAAAHPPKETERPAPIPRGLKQLAFSASLIPELVSQAKVMARPAPLPKGLEQLDFESLLTTYPAKAPSERVRKTPPAPGRHGHTAQLGFDSLEQSPLIADGIAAPGKPAEGGNGVYQAQAHWPDIQTDEPAETGLPDGPGESDTPYFPARRVILDEPEPETRHSRDFRITEESGVGTGGLHEKYKANITAIRLVKTLEAENREAEEEEKAVLVRYAGWGALKDVFEPEWAVKQEWRAAATELKGLLTEEEYESARSTTPNAHFTSPLVIRAIWEGLEKLGVRGSVEVLEPA